MMKYEHLCSCLLFWPDRRTGFGSNPSKLCFWPNLSNSVCSAKPVNPWQTQASPQKDRPTLLLLPEWVALLSAFRSQSRRGEFNGLNLNFRFFHPQAWTWGHTGDKCFSHASVFGIFWQVPEVLYPADSFCEGSLGAQLCWSPSRRWVPVSFVGFTPSTPLLSDTSTSRPDP